MNTVVSMGQKGCANVFVSAGAAAVLAEENF
jgi:hypothetical protein